MLTRLIAILAIALLYLADVISVGAPILTWFAIASFADLSEHSFFLGWIVIMLFSATLWLKILERVRKKLWDTLIERTD
jgi:hypothetical protein